MNYLSITNYLITVPLHGEPKHFSEHCILQTSYSNETATFLEEN